MLKILLMIPTLSVSAFKITNLGSVLVWFGADHKQQVKAGSEWLKSEELDGLSDFVMEPRISREVPISVGRDTQSCRLLLTFGETPARTRWAHFCSQHEYVCSKFPKMCFWVSQRLHKDPVLRTEVFEMTFPTKPELPQPVFENVDPR